MADVQPIITILGLKKTGQAYFVTLGALVSNSFEIYNTYSPSLPPSTDKKEYITLSRFW